MHKDGELFGLERRLNESQTLKVSRDPSGLKADVLQNPLETRTRTVRGSIDHSLFEAVESAGAHDQTAVALADIFGWDIDFVLDVRPGDTFAVTYDEVLARRHLPEGRPDPGGAVRQPGRASSAPCATPTRTATRTTTRPTAAACTRRSCVRRWNSRRVSSRFNSARLHPILNRIRAHKGVDYAAPMGTPVRAAGDGRVLLRRRRWAATATWSRSSTPAAS